MFFFLSKTLCLLFVVALLVCLSICLLLYILICMHHQILTILVLIIVLIVIGALSTIAKEVEDLEIRGQVETIQTTALLKSVRMLRRVLET